jgi:outer membrane protein OmpA-like peptidoglycan-associated protein
MDRNWRWALWSIGLGIVLGACRATGPARPSSQAATSPGASSVPARPFKAFPVYTDKAPRDTHYAPSGYMGDSDLTMSGAYTQTPQGEGPCLRVNYKASGPKGWAGIYWQDPANNWGDIPGRAGYDLRGATRVTFWARGESGGERIHEFRVGGIVGQYPDSDVATLSNIRLTPDWKPYLIDLAKKDLRHVIGGFGLFVNKAENPGGMVFYLDDIIYVGPEAAPQAAAVSASTAPLLGQLPAETTAQAAPPALPAVKQVPLPAVVKDLEVKPTEAGLRVSFSSRLQFESGRAVLLPSSHKVLDQLVSLLSAYAKNRVLIEGHTDSTGDAHLNLRLSELRARAVRDYLIQKGGYDFARFQTVGYGSTKPVADNGTKVGRSLNRRVEVTILKEK